MLAFSNNLSNNPSPNPSPNPSSNGSPADTTDTADNQSFTLDDLIISRKEPPKSYHDRAVQITKNVINLAMPNAYAAYSTTVGAIDAYNSMATKGLINTWLGPSVMREIMKTPMIQPLSYKNNIVTYKYLKISSFPSKRGEPEKRVEMISSGPMQKKLSENDLKLLQFCREAILLTEDDAIYLLTTFFHIVGGGMGPCGKYGDWIRGISSNFFQVDPQDNYLKKYAYMANSLYKMGTNVPPILQGLVAMHTRFLAMCSLQSIVLSLKRGERSAKRYKDAINAPLGEVILKSTIGTLIMSFANDESTFLWERRKPYEAPSVDLETNRNIFRLFKKTNDLIFNIFYDTPSHKNVGEFMQETYGVSDYFDVLNSNVRKAIPVKKKRERWWDRGYSPTDSEAPKTEVISVLKDMVKPYEPVNLDPLGDAYSVEEKGSSVPVNPLTQTKMNIIESVLKGVDKSTVYVFRGVLATVAGGMAFYTWTRNQRQIISAKYPERVKYIKFAEKNWNDRQNLQNFVTLVQLFRDVPLTKGRKAVLYEYVVEEHQKIKLKKLRQEIYYPLKFYHKVMGLAAYVILCRYLNKWAQYFYWLWKKDDKISSKYIFKIKKKTTGTGVANLARSAISKVWTLFNDPKTADWVSKKHPVLYKYFLTNSFSTALKYIFVGIVGVVFIRFFALLLPQNGIMAFARLFSYMEHNAPVLFATLFGKKVPGKEDQVKKEAKKLKEFASKQVREKRLEMSLNKKIKAKRGKTVREKAEREKAKRGKAVREKAKREKVERGKAVKEKAKREKAKREKVERGHRKGLSRLKQTKQPNQEKGEKEEKEGLRKKTFQIKSNQTTKPRKRRRNTFNK